MLGARVSGPVEGARPPAGAPRRDLAAIGYVCEEYQLEGTAVAYGHPERRPPSDGRWDPVELGEAAYRTRLLVVRPAGMAPVEGREGFNGTVLLHWQNVSAGRESGRPDSDELYRGGYAWVGVSAQEVGLYGLPTGMGGRFPAGRPLVDADPERYGNLVHPGDAGSFEIFGQAAAAVGPDRGGDVDPMGGLPVRRVVATGGSQSAMRLVAYANGVHALHRVLDGFLLCVWEGRAPRLDDGPIGDGGVRTAVRPDLGVPVLIVNSEFETTGTTPLELPDTDTFRLWEVAGTAHGAIPAGSRPGSAGRNGEPAWAPNSLSWAPVHEAATRQIHRWLVDGRPAPTQARIEIDPDSGRVRRDDYGNALGGIRLPQMAAPVAEHRGMAFGTGQPPMLGGRRPFTPEVLRSLYPSRQVFVERWVAATDALVRTGALLPEDGPAVRDQAAGLAASLPVG
jgi:hypothetical protein